MQYNLLFLSLHPTPLVFRLALICWMIDVSGKKYVFDIQRTCREVYDNARRTLYQTGEDTQLSSVSSRVANKPVALNCPDASCEVRLPHIS